MSDMYELKAAVIAVKENSDLPIITSMILTNRAGFLQVATLKVPLLCLRDLGLTQSALTAA